MAMSLFQSQNLGLSGVWSANQWVKLISIPKEEEAKDNELMLLYKHNRDTFETSSNHITIHNMEAVQAEVELGGGYVSAQEQCDVMNKLLEQNYNQCKNQNEIKTEVKHSQLV